MRPQHHLAKPPYEDNPILRSVDHPSGFLSLSPKNHIFTVPGACGFVAYREQGIHFMVFGGVHAPQDCAQALLDEFLLFAERKNRRIVVVQLRDKQLHLFRERGFVVNQFGSNFCLRLSSYSFSGSQKVKLRNKLRRARRAGLRVVEVGREVKRTSSIFDDLNRISDAWLAAKNKKALDFMVGEIGVPEETRRRIFLVQTADQEICGFISYVPAWCDKPGLLHDLTRRLPSAPSGSMELCNAFAMERLKEEGVEYLHFGFTPFIVDDTEPPGGNRFLSWAIRKTRRYGSAIYPAESQALYKEKWGLDFVEREYLAARSFTFRALWDLLVLTRSI